MNLKEVLFDKLLKSDYEASIVHKEICKKFGKDINDIEFKQEIKNILEEFNKKFDSYSIILK